MTERSDEFREEANRIAGTLLSREGRFAPESSDRDLRPGLYIDDVRQEARQFSTDIELLRDIGGVPAIRIDEGTVVPVALDYLVFQGGPPRWWRSFPFPLYREYLHYFVREWGEDKSDGKTVLSIREAIEAMRDGMAGFLATRITSVADFFEPRDVTSSGSNVRPVPLLLAGIRGQTRIKTVGFTVTVHSTPGLRIHVSPSFRINWRYFGAPSTPTTGTLTGGIYRFAADGGLYAGMTPDSGKFDIPYATTSPRLNV